MERGPVIILRNPQWKTNDLYQDIPVMVFTRAQWDAEHRGIFFLTPAVLYMKCGTIADTCLGNTAATMLTMR